MSSNDSKESAVVVSQRGDMLTITLNSPSSANALSAEMVETILETFNGVHNVRLCVIRAEGKNFCAGFDLADIESMSDADLLWRFVRIEQMLQTVYHAPFPTLALVQRHVVGAGADLMAACWKRVAAPDLQCRMPGWQFELALGTRRLSRLVGNDSARDILIDSRTVDAQEALNIGLVNVIVPPENWDKIIADTLSQVRSLPERAQQDMLAITSIDTRDEDLASVIRTAARPGLKQRILDYRQRVRNAN